MVKAWEQNYGHGIAKNCLSIWFEIWLMFLTCILWFVWVTMGRKIWGKILIKILYQNCLIYRRETKLSEWVFLIKIWGGLATISINLW